MTTQIDVARLYIDALVTHEGDTVPFAPDCVRWEVGIKTGRSGDHLRRSLTRGPQFRLVQRIRDLTTTVDGDVVRTSYLLDAGIAGRTLTTVRVDEDFRIPADDLRIHRIDAKIRPVRKGSATR